MAAGCHGCPVAGPKVPGEWHRQGGEPVLLVLGIGPGKTEISLRRPFVGASGRILRPWLDRINPRGGIYLTNTVQCNIQTPRKDHLLACAGRLLEELDRIRPDAVICLGQIAERAYKASGWRSPMEGCPHPAVVLYRGMARHAWVERAQMSWMKLRGALGQLEKPQQITLTGRKALAVDTEYKHEVHDGFDLCVVYDGERAESYRLGDTQTLQERLSHCDDLVFHHAVNDLVSLKARGVTVPDNVAVQCTMTAKGVIDPGGSRDLKVITTNLGYVSDEPDLSKWKQGKVDERVVEEYCKDDTRRTLLAWQKYRHPALAHPLYRETYQPLLRILADMSRLEVDQDTLTTIVQEQEAEQRAAEKTLLRFGEINWYSPEQVADFLIQKYAIEFPDTELGHYRVDEEVLTDLIATYPGIPEAPLILDLRRTRKILGTYVYPLQKRGYLGTVYDPVGARTGRMASSRMNVQNIPPSVRAAIKAPGGQAFVSADYSNHEVRTAAWISQDPVLFADVQGTDFHANLAHLFAHREIKDDQERTMWKHISFGSIYLGTEKTLMTSLKALGIEMTEDQVVEFLVKFWERYHGYLEWIDRLKAMAKDRGQIISPFGRAFPVTPKPDIRVWREVVNELIQGTASDFTARSLLRAVQAGLHPLVVVHDSIAVQAPNDGEAITEIVSTLRKAMLLEDAPLAVKFTVGMRWGKPAKVGVAA